MEYFNLSKESKNRILIWQIMLEKAYAYLTINSSIDKYNSDMDLSFFILDKPFQFNSKVYTSIALVEASVIWFSSIFMAGKSNINGIADNKDMEVNSFRERMLEYTIEKLNCKREDFNNFKNTIMSNRNELFAHYDGSKSEYKENGSVTQMKLPGTGLSDYEVNEFTKIIKHMLDFVSIQLYGFND